MNIIGEVSGYDCIFVDDIVDSGGMFCNVVDVLFDQGVKFVMVYIIYGVLLGGVVVRVIFLKFKELVIINFIELIVVILVVFNIWIILIVLFLGEVIN